MPTTREAILELYSAGIPISEITRILGCSKTLIYKVKTKHGVPNRRKKFNHQVICDLYQSGKSIPEICRELDCSCGAVVPCLKKHGIETRSISDAIHLARGGRISKQRGGYLFINTGKNSRVLQHRKIVEAIIGRPLEKNEVVHHKDGDKSNNSPENLELLTRSEHTRLHHELRRNQP